MSRKRNNPEQRLHMAVAQYLALALRPPTIWTTIGHGGGGKTRGALLKAMGVQPGWPDILVMHYAGLSHYGVSVTGIELKAAKGRLSPAQREMDSAFFSIGARFYICRSVDDVEAALRSMKVPLHASVSGTVIEIEAAGPTPAAPLSEIEVRETRDA